MDKSFEIYLIRHGQTAWSLSGQHTGRTDIPLTEEGRKRAATLHKPLSAIPFKEVYSSPLSRAVETAQIAGFSPRIDTDLLEWDYGAFEGITTADIHKKAPHWNLFEAGAPQGESAADVGRRADHFIAGLSEKEGPIAIFSHGHFLRVFVARWLKLPPSAGALFMLSTESMSILGFEHNSLEPVVKLWNAKVAPSSL